MKKILITGVTGFVGKYVAEALVDSPDVEVHGTYFSEDGRTRLGDLERKLLLHKVDLTQKKEVESLITDILPDQIYNLAAQTSPSESMKDPEKTLSTNILSELYLFEALKEKKLENTRVLAIASAEVYGKVSSKDLPIDEMTQFRPISPYAVSKIGTDFLALQYFLTHKLQIIRVRPFNHIGPGQQPKFVLPMFAKQIADIEKGLQEPVMKVGNLKARKDFSDVRDIVRAYTLLMEKGEAGEVYNIGAGKSISIQEMLDILLSLSEKEIKVEVDQSLVRPVDVEDMYADISKIKTATGWTPSISIEETMKDTLDYFRKVI